MKALSVANYLIDLAAGTEENDLTNLKLQKLLYYVQGMYLAKNGDPLFEDTIEAWKFGPVVPVVYHTFKSCGSFPITVFDVSYETAELNQDQKSFVEKVWNDIGKKYSGYFLVQKTHAPGTPWKKVYTPNEENIEIAPPLLREYFLAHSL